MKLNENKQILPKRYFEHFLRKAAKPKKPDSKVTGTSVAHPSDGCSGKRKNRDKTEGKEG